MSSVAGRTQWYHNAVYYEIYLRSFMDGNHDGIGDLRGLSEKLDYLQNLGVDCIWLLPIYPSPRKDDGYDIADYYAIDPVYGTLEEFKQLVKRVHKRGMRLIMDLVVNHTSDQHPWFQAARSEPDSPYRDYYVWNDHDDLYKDARIIFLDTEESNWTWDEKAGMYYWHRFYSSQPDLNYDNPAVRTEMLNIMRFWLDMGIDGFRVDAVPYLFEQDGTNCENLPRTHEYLKEMRAFVDRNYTDKVLICEANQPPEDVRAYLGDSDEFHLAFHFPLMPKIFMAMQTNDKTQIEQTIKSTPAIPENCQWGTFLRNHDELTLEMVTAEERDWMWQEYAPQPNMRLNLGIRRRLAPLLDNNRQKIELAHNILFTLPGTPFLYYGDEIGMGDDLSQPDRNGVRTPMQWNGTSNAGFSKNKVLSTPVITDASYSPAKVNVQQSIAKRDSLWHAVRKLIRLRKNETVFQGDEINFIENGNPKILSFTRANDQGELHIFHNLSGDEISITHKIPATEIKKLDDLKTNTSYAVNDGYVSFKMKPYQSLILKSGKKTFLGL